METKRLNSEDHEDIIIESQRIQVKKRTDKTHKDNIADRGHVSMSHYNMVQKPISILKTVTILEADVSRQGKSEQ